MQFANLKRYRSVKEIFRSIQTFCMWVGEVGEYLKKSYTGFIMLGH